ncbi:MAG: dynamin family protein [Myxococcota bacterium]|nr:dynamin family protein [Myxococcota bacterium]
MKLKIEYSGQQTSEMLEDLFERTKSVLQGSSSLAVLPKDWGLQRNLSIRKIKKRLNRPLCVAVIGDFKRGKSTLVNALLGKEVVSTDVLPETVTITEIYSGEKDTTALHLADGGVIHLSNEDRVSNRLEEVIRNVHQPVSHLKITYASPKMNNSMIVDTPGLGDLNWRFDKMVQQWIGQADVVLYVISAISPLSESERQFLYNSLKPLEVSKLTFVVNMMDKLHRPTDRQNILNKVRQSLASDFPDAKVIGVSALQSYERQLDPQSPIDPDLDLAFKELEEQLDLIYESQNDLVRSERVTKAFHQLMLACCRDIGLTINDLTEASVSAEEKMLALKKEQELLMAQLPTQQEHLQQTFDGFQAETAEWMTEFVDRFYQEVLPQIETVDGDHSQRHFPFFVSDVFKEALSTCIYHHLEQLSTNASVDVFGDSTDVDPLESEIKDIHQRSLNPFDSGSFAGNVFLVGSVAQTIGLSVGVGWLSSSVFLGHLGGIIAGTAFLATTSALGLMKDKKVNNPEVLQEALSEAKKELCTGIVQSVTEKYAEILEITKQNLEQQHSKAVEHFAARIEMVEQTSQRDKDENQELLEQTKTLNGHLTNILEETISLRGKQIRSIGIQQ